MFRDVSVHYTPVYIIVNSGTLTRPHAVHHVLTVFKFHANFHKNRVFERSLTVVTFYAITQEWRVWSLCAVEFASFLLPDICRGQTKSGDSGFLFSGHNVHQTDC